MFRKTRKRIVFTVVLSLLILLTVTLTTIYLSNRIALRHEHENMLNAYIERYTLNEPEGGRPDFVPDDTLPPDRRGEKDGLRDDPQFRLSTFYSVAFSPDGTVLAVQSGNRALYDDEALTKVASSLLQSGAEDGVRGSLYFRVADRGEYTLVAMIDGTLGQQSQQTLFRQMLIFGGAAMVVLFVLSIFIARRIVRPLEENDKRQKRFVSDAGHELKTPIAVISANSELLKREIGDNEWLANIDYENERMSDLVKQLLALSKAESGVTPKQPLDFSKLVDGEVLPFESLAFEKGKRVAAEIEAGLSVDGNPNQLRQLVSILLDNALAHGTGDVIALSLRRERRAAVLTVSNDADHMSAEQTAHLFDRFYRADEARNEADAHYGLGLSIAQAVTDAHGGQIRAEYKNGQAFFTVSIPLRKN
ncbi:MAG: HAMP domain-containing histidine kinase [Clostridia bacterium]|nr:HAMP domain-containing histidine kinase [Clostridia bacterium]